MRVNADSLLIRAAATSTSGTLNDLTTDLIMANNNNNNHIIVLYTNADVLTQEKKRELGVHITQEKPHMIAITEVNPKARCFQQQDYQIPNYVMFDVNAGAQGRRGVVVFIHTSLEKLLVQLKLCLNLKKLFCCL